MIKLIRLMSSRLDTIALHMVFIIAYYLYEIGMVYAYTGNLVYFWDALAHFAINVCLFYFNAHVVLQYCSTRQNKLTSIVSVIPLILLEFLLFLTMKYFVNSLLPELGIPTTRPYQNWAMFLRDVIWRFIYLFGLSCAYWFAMSSAAKQSRLARLEHARLRELAEQEIMKQDLLSTENAFLKSQINSHFLFNTLSYLHSSVLDVNQQAAQTILHLSDILRYSLTTPASGKVKLADELAYVSHIFQISKFKSSKPVHLEFTITGNPGDQQVIPLILITLAENMLKYADFYDKGNPAKFSCQITGNSLSIFVSDKKRKSVFPFNAGIGLENTKKRLNLAYQENYSLDIINADTRYELTLIIPLEDAIQNNNR